jgi:hypothetical protein
MSYMNGLRACFKPHWQRRHWTVLIRASRAMRCTRGLLCTRRECCRLCSSSLPTTLHDPDELTLRLASSDRHAAGRQPLRAPTTRLRARLIPDASFRVSVRQHHPSDASTPSWHIESPRWLTLDCCPVPYYSHRSGCHTLMGPQSTILQLPELAISSESV